jgi:methanogenic corrinoid protein MtbC1
MGLFLAQMMTGRKHGEHAPTIENNVYVGHNVRILSLSYDSNIVASVHNDVTEIGKNLIQSLVTNSRCDNLLYLWTH